MAEMRFFWTSLLLVATLLSVGCRAMSDKAGSAPSASPAPTGAPPKPTAPPPKPAAPSQSSPTPKPSKDIDFKENFRKDLLREALGRASLALLNSANLVYEKTSDKGAATPNFWTEFGKIRFDQVLGTVASGASTLHIGGPYHRVVTTSGPQVTSFGPLAVDLSAHDLGVASTCGHDILVNGAVRCTVSGVYDHSSQVMDASGQCMTHTGGVLDNLRLDIGGGIHTARYVLSIKAHGNPLSWSSYTWTGMAYINGLKTELPDTSSKTYKCD